MGSHDPEKKLFQKEINAKVRVFIGGGVCKTKQMNKKGNDGKKLSPAKSNISVRQRLCQKLKINGKGKYY